jgi:plasmid stability protein
MRAAGHGCFMEEERRDILRRSIAARAPRPFGQGIHGRFAAPGGVGLAPPARGPMRAMPRSFSSRP